MLFESTAPKKSRAHFKTKGLINFALIFALFAVVVFIMSWMLRVQGKGIVAMLIGDTLALAGAYALLVWWDTKKSIQIECPSCHKLISSGTPWECKVCGGKNMDTDNFPFVHKCGTCGVSPKAYKCHHCGAFIFLTDDEDTTNYAHCLNSQAERPGIPRAELEAKIAKLEAEVKEYQEKSAAVKVKSARDRRLEQLDQKFQSMMGASEFVISKKSEIEVTFKNHPEQKEKALEVLKRIQIEEA